jgi:hypothetical protein
MWHNFSICRGEWRNSRKTLDRIAGVPTEILAERLQDINKEPWNYTKPFDNSAVWKITWYANALGINATDLTNLT